MTVNSYLANFANSAILRDKEKISVQRSISTLKTRLNLSMKKELTNQFIFGSYSRGTILPRSMDVKSDVDYMVVFSDTSFKPQTYLDKLRRFVNSYYPSSEIKQSNPTIILSLNHINVELIPAIDAWFYGLQIPAKASDFEDWQDTDPTGFNRELSEANKQYKNFIKPLARILKYWNAKNKYPFESYELEKSIVQRGYGIYGLFGADQLKDLFYEYIENMESGWFDPQWKQDAVNRAKQLAAEAKYQESSGNYLAAENAIKKLIPPVTMGLLGALS